MKTIITTVGTSIFENYMSTDIETCIKTSYKAISTDIRSIRNKSKSSTDYDDFNIEIEDKIKKTLKSHWFKGIYRTKNEKNEWIWKKKAGILNESASAEIKSILEIAANEEVEVHLIATDTVLSVVAAELIKEWFEESNKSITVYFEYKKITEQSDSEHIIKDLRVNNNVDYQKGFMNLISLLNAIIPNTKNVGKDYILNITGGYKVIIPIITLYGQIKDIQLNYIFDESKLDGNTQLIAIGKLPFSFDWNLAELYLDDLSRDGLRQMNSKPEILGYLRKINLIQKDAYKLTPLGSLFVNHLRDQLTDKKSTLGYLVELKVFEYFTQKEQNTTRGKAYWWDMKNRSLYSEEAQYNQDDKKEQKIDLDIFIKKNVSEEWYEVKSCSKTGLKKAFKQFKVMLDFIEKTSYTDIQKIGLILYKLSTTDIDFYQKQINNIRGLFRKSPLQLSIQYIDIPETQDGLFNTKRFFERNLTLIQLE